MIFIFILNSIFLAAKEENIIKLEGIKIAIKKKTLLDFECIPIENNYKQKTIQKTESPKCIKNNSASVLKCHSYRSLRRDKKFVNLL